MKTKNCNRITLLFILTALTINVSGQYFLMTRGAKCPFDSAVAVELKTYRMEGLKLKAGDALIRNLTAENTRLAALSTVQDTISSNCSRRLDIRDKQIESKQLALNDMSKQYDALQVTYKRTQSWWKKNKGWIGLGTGFFIGGVTTAFILR